MKLGFGVFPDAVIVREIWRCDGILIESGLIRVSSISSQAPNRFLRSKFQTRIKVRSLFRLPYGWREVHGQNVAQHANVM